MITKFKEKHKLIGFRAPYMYTKKATGETYPACHFDIAEYGCTGYDGGKVTSHFVRLNSLSDIDVAYVKALIGEFVYCDMEGDRVRGVYALEDVYG